ncbi:MFS transporter [Paraburkholderia sp. ZP32-5]|uniref:MFS transporter n=1 Tax=Paraburkholderia sp. ZP32-5 TaxID=2883245 RepID=UPI001F2231C1|nr:MFS transporter [Paraburkholderia sp. ZP32-5]
MSTTITHGGAARSDRPCWRGVLAIALGGLALVVIEFLPVGLLPGIIKGFGVSEGTAGLTVTATAAFGFIAAPITALSVGRLDRRIVLLALSALVVVSGIISTLAPNFAVLLLARVLLGIGVGGFWSISIIAASRLVPADKVPKASSLVFSGISVATVISVPMGAYIADHAGWRIAFGIASVLAIAVFIFQLVALPKIETPSAVTSADFASLLKSRKIIAVYLAIVFIVAGHFAAYTFVTPYLQQVVRFDANEISSVLLLYGALAVVGAFLAGVLASRDLRKTVYANVALFFASLIAMAVSPAHWSIVLVGLVLWAVCWGMAPVGTQLWLFNATQHAPEAAQSMNTCVFQLSITCGSLIGGLAVDHIDLHASMWTGAAILLLAVMAVLAVGRIESADMLSASQTEKAR